MTAVKKLRLVYIDPYSEFGHVNLNKVFIRTLVNAGFDVRLVLRDGYIRDLGFPDEMVELSLPHRLFVEGKGSLASRLGFLGILRHIKKNVDLSAFDRVFFSGYEEMSLALSGIRQRLFLVNHANPSSLENFWKRQFIRHVSKGNVHIVFAPFIRDQMLRYGIDNVVVEPLGLSEPYRPSPEDSEILASVLPTYTTGAFRRILFSPTGIKYGSDFVGRLIEDLRFLEFLRETGTLLVVKDNVLKSASGNVVILDAVISDDQYRVLFAESAAVVVAYPESFNYRVSAVLFECLSNGKPCFLSDIEGFRAFQGHFNYDPFFRSIPDLIHALRQNLPAGGFAGAPYRNLELQHPNFQSVLAG